MSSLSQLLINYSAAPSKIKLAPQPSSITFYGRPTNIDSKMFFFIDLQFPVDISGHHLPFFILFKQPHSMVRKCRVIKFFIKILVQKMLESTTHMALQYFFSAVRILSNRQGPCDDFDSEFCPLAWLSKMSKFSIEYWSFLGRSQFSYLLSYMGNEYCFTPKFKNINFLSEKGEKLRRKGTEETSTSIFFSEASNNSLLARLSNVYLDFSVALINQTVKQPYWWFL